MSRSAAAPLCFHLPLPWPPIHLAWSALLAVMKAMSYKVHSVWSVSIQASGPPHHQPAQVFKYAHFTYTLCISFCTCILKGFDQYVIVNIKILVLLFFLPHSCEMSTAWGSWKWSYELLKPWGSVQLTVLLHMQKRVLIRRTWAADVWSSWQLDWRKSLLPR